ncbi:MAG: TonB-dependent receptor [Acidobacteriaceae bacterium]
MRRAAYLLALPVLFVFLLAGTRCLLGQGTGGSVHGTVVDAAGASISGATVELINPVSGLHRTTTTDAAGVFSIRNVPFQTCYLAVSAPGFSAVHQDIKLITPVPIDLTMTMAVANSSTTVTVSSESGDLLSGNPSYHTNIDMSKFSKVPDDDPQNGLSGAITLASPGIAADSNGMFHPLGEHADTDVSMDGEPDTDQQSRTFTNQLTSHAIQSMKIINGIVPPEYGDKVSLIVQATTKSSLGDVAPTGSITSTYGSFGTASSNVEIGVGGKKWGNFVDMNGLNGGRFLDTPEFSVMHAYGNNENYFERIDYDPSSSDTLHLDLNAARTWAQNPNQYDQQAAGQDQREQIFTYNAAGFWTRVLNERSLLDVNAYIRQDNFHYYPSANIFADTPATLSQSRRLQNIGLHSDYSYAHGVHNIKAGASFQVTFLNEGFGFGITSPTYNAVCQDTNGTPVVAPGVTKPSQCVAAGYQPNPNFLPGELQYDLTRKGHFFTFKGNAAIKEEALYYQDNIVWHNWQFLIGARGDNYNGLSRKYMLEPRAGATYALRTGTIISAAYARLMPTPYNENLILSSYTGNGGLANNLGAFGQHPLTPATRNQYNAGLQQGFGKYVVVSAQYFWKYTEGDYDFDVILNTPLTFPIQWKKSDITGADAEITMVPIHGISAYTTMGHSHSLFYPPEIGGIIFNDNSNAVSSEPFLIDHDQVYEQNSHVQYQPKATGPWYGFTWRYASGLVAGAVPFGTAPGVPISLTYLTPDQQQQIKLSCNGVYATLNAPLTSCLPSQLQSPLVYIPAAGTYTPYSNPPRVSPRSLFDMDAGWQNIFHKSRYQTDLILTATNIANKDALYNYLSTFSGTHFTPPRMVTVSATFNF